MIISALHGFLGRPEDFDAFAGQLKPLGGSFGAVDYLKVRELSPENDFKSWGANFNHYVQTQNPSAKKRVLVGYSLGGRLALHAVQNNPALWSGLVLISANPGIPIWERAERLARDQDWAKEFETKNFGKILQEWNAQPIFQGSVSESVRKESDYNRHILAKCLTQWSVGHQEDFREFLKTTAVPVMYISGARDVKYVSIGENLKKTNSRIQVSSIANAGHRVLFDQPQILGELINKFVGVCS